MFEQLRTTITSPPVIVPVRRRIVRVCSNPKAAWATFNIHWLKYACCLASHYSHICLQAHAFPLNVWPSASPGFHPIPRIIPRPNDSMDTCVQYHQYQFITASSSSFSKSSALLPGVITPRDLFVVFQRRIIRSRHNIHLEGFSAHASFINNLHNISCIIEFTCH